MARNWIVPIATALIAVAPGVAAQSTPAATSSARPVIGLALSGGGAKGLAHIGVLRVLEAEGIAIDVVAGTSMGGVIGGLYAMGTPLDSIQSLMESADWGSILVDQVERDRRFLHQRRFDERTVLTLPLENGKITLPSGAIVGSNIYRLLEQATWPAATTRNFLELPRPFIAVATDIETGAAVTLSSGVLAEVMRASAGVPGALEPFEIDGRFLVDGALSRNLPASDARALGADMVICSDVSDPLDSAEELESFFDVLNQVLTLSMVEAAAEQRAFCDVLISPDIEGLSTLSFDQSQEWIARGIAAAQNIVPGLGSTPPARIDAVARPADFLGDSVRIARIDIQSCCRDQIPKFVRDELQLRPGDYIGPYQLGSRLSDIEATGLFGLVRYRLDDSPADDGVVLTIHVQERARDRLGVGIRYDDERRAALLFSTTRHNLVRYGSVTRLDLRVGEETRVGGTYLRRYGVTGRFEGGSSLSWSQSLIRLPDGAGDATEFEVAEFSTFLGLVAGRTLFLGLEVAVERAAADVDSIPTLNILSVSGVLDHETLDRIDFPRSGVDLTAEWEWGTTNAPGSGAFSVASVDARYFVPLSQEFTLEANIFVGAANGTALPIHRLFYLGGAHPTAVFPRTQPTFHGIGPQEVSGTSVQVARLGLRWDFAPDFNVGIHTDIGGTMDSWTLPVEDPLVSWALSGGWRTLVGPVRLELAKASDRSDARLSLSVGRRF